MTALRQAALLCALALVPALVSAWWHRDVWEADPGRLLAGEVRLAEVKQWSARVVWVDARGRSAFKQAHIPEAVLLNEDEWDALLPGLLERWRPGDRVVVYCDSAECHASAELARRLREEVGLPEVYVLYDGWTAWVEADQ